jgi:hypothetical protein
MSRRMAILMVLSWPELNCSAESTKQQGLIEAKLAGNEEVSIGLLRDYCLRSSSLLYFKIA